MISIVEDELFNEVIRAKLDLGARKQVLELADRYMECGENGYRYLKKGMEAVGQFSNNLSTIVLVPIFEISSGNGVLIFDLSRRSSEDILESLKNINTKIDRPPLPEKAFVKYVLARMENLIGYVELHNKSIQTRSDGEYIIELVNIDSIAAYQKLIEDFSDKTRLASTFVVNNYSKALKNWTKVFMQPGLTDKIIEKAWDQYIIKSTITK